MHCMAANPCRALPDQWQQLHPSPWQNPARLQADHGSVTTSTMAVNPATVYKTMASLHPTPWQSTPLPSLQDNGNTASITMAVTPGMRALTKTRQKVPVSDSI